MAVAIDTANVVVNGNSAAANPQQFNVTCAAADNLLVLFVGTDLLTSAAIPSSVTYNAVSLTMLTPSTTFSSNYRGTVSIWYMLNPPTGSALQVSITNPTTPTGAVVVAVPISGNGGSAPVIGTGAFASSAAAACSVTGAGSNDVQLAMCFIRGAALTSGGAPQAAVPGSPVAGSIDFGGADSIPGASAGNFSWTLTSNNWIAQGITVFGTASGGTTQSMPANSSFNPQGNTFLVTTNATPSTASAQLVSFNPTLSAQVAAQASGLQNCPPAVCVANLGTAVVYVSFTSALRTAIVPAANPQLELPVFPGVERVFTLPQSPNVGSATPYALQINTISSAASQPLLITFGEQHLT